MRQCCIQRSAAVSDGPLSQSMLCVSESYREQCSLTGLSSTVNCCAGALNNLACLYEHGSELTARDISVAIDYYRAAAQLGCAAAQAGSSRGRGRGVAWRGVAQRSAEGF